MKLLIDADYIVYKSCAAAETEIDFGEDLIVVTSNFSDVMKNIQRELDKIKKEFFDSTLILFFSHHTNFRKKLYPDYKGHRNRKKPCGYKRAIKALELKYEVIIMEELEADDALGIYATANPGNVIVSPDKDMRQIPGKLYDLKDVTTIDAQKLVTSGTLFRHLQATKPMAMLVCLDTVLRPLPNSLKRKDTTGKQ